MFFLLNGATRSATAGQLGAKVPDFRLSDQSGRQHSLSDYSGKVVVLAFWAFKCPVSLAYDERLRAVQDKYRSAGTVVLAVNSNSNESLIEIQRNAANLKLPFPVLLDEDAGLADRLKATQTPSFYVIDRSGVLRYQGSLDNKRPGENGRIAYLEQALDDVLAGRAVGTPETRVSGCSIRRKTM